MDRQSPGAGERATAADPEPPAPNWYPDPGRSGGFRYWDGRQWTEHTAAGPAAAGGGWPAPAVSPRPDGFAVASLILGVAGGSLLAVVFGFVARGRIRRSGGARTGHGLATAGIVLGCVWMAALTVGIALSLTGALEQKNTD